MSTTRIFVAPPELKDGLNEALLGLPRACPNIDFAVDHAKGTITLTLKDGGDECTWERRRGGDTNQSTSSDPHPSVGGEEASDTKDGTAGH
jgi:hypothetical protein